MSDQLAAFDHWVTIDDHHVLIKGGDSGEGDSKGSKGKSESHAPIDTRAVMKAVDDAGLRQKGANGDSSVAHLELARTHGIIQHSGDLAKVIEVAKNIKEVGASDTNSGAIIQAVELHKAGYNTSDSEQYHQSRIEEAKQGLESLKNEKSARKVKDAREYHEGTIRISQDNLDHLKKLKEAIGKAKFGEEMSDKEQLQLATFDLNGSFEETDDYVIVKGKIFEAGRFEDKQFEISPEELAAATEGFQPVPVDYSHVEGPLDGKMGELRSVSLAENGRDLMGEVAIPKWLDKALGDTARKVSCTWNRVTKRLEKLALVNNPRINDAVLYSFFIADQEEKQNQNQAAEFEGKRNSTADHKTIQSIHDHCMSLGAKCSGENAEYSNPTNDNKELPTMSDENKTVDFKDSPEYQALQAQFTAQQNEIERMKAEKRHSDAVAAVEELLRAGKAVPAEKVALVAAFEQAAADDAKSPMQVTFGEGLSGSRVDALKAVYAARPAHVLFGETVPVGAQVLMSQDSGNGTSQEISEARVKELLAQSSFGQAVLKGDK